ncbi:sporulation peptidase YabG [Proteinivorax hydrogeniformans]|uniref:Sporulation peptidase YabG n=1 Tax=Proteinivorax hydrogeniformans TaxID=1826727 RepID=A0AAU8HT71_9FIRM
MEFKVGDIVARKSYKCDIYFAVYEIDWDKKIAYLKGLDLRIQADAPLRDLKKINSKELIKHKREMMITKMKCINKIESARKQEQINLGIQRGDSKSKYYEIPGKIVHIDGDKEYLKTCTLTYRQLNLNVVPFFIAEKDQPREVGRIVKEHSPDILVITGHDGINKESKYYRNSKHFILAVKKARKVEPNKDDLFIFAGACQSDYEGVIEAGANFASSPNRVLIHCLDPVIVAQKVAYTPISKIISIEEVIENTITGMDGIGGIESVGKFRLGLPKYKEDSKNERH